MKHYSHDKTYRRCWRGHLVRHTYAWTDEAIIHQLGEALHMRIGRW